ncbi:hypothetical protein [Methanobrevibacter sp.]|uniref:hypothetical protein n=1 Tax=Methanobrevibacter sp. TaxID=66852 RepID=UPI0025EE580E|nr:hypothetical protein [Methanobrevibacter sp.]MBQ2832390.1 hypothetical protein [Methanobrevibacter sp.]
MIGIYGVKDKNRFVLEFENEDILFMQTIISLIGERNRLQKEIEIAKGETHND